MTIKGSIKVENIHSTGNASGGFCFEVQNAENDDWTVCADTQEIKNMWLKSISEALGVAWEKDSGVIIEQVLDKQTVIYMSKESARCNDGWNFYTHGVDWECKCIEGSE